VRRKGGRGDQACGRRHHQRSSDRNHGRETPVLLKGARMVLARHFIGMKNVLH
jgi:hypothetical protein